jgi:hypothetical protein
MGLDMYAYIRNDEEDKPTEIAYWRKHNRLHGWMENLYHEKGGTEEFNCVPVLLTVEDLDRLEKIIECKALPETNGFFFGGDSYEEYEEWYKEDDLKFIKVARQSIEDGNKVYYDSWW